MINKDLFENCDNDFTDYYIDKVFKKSEMEKII